LASAVAPDGAQRIGLPKARYPYQAGDPPAPTISRNTPIGRSMSFYQNRLDVLLLVFCDGVRLTGKDA